MSQPGPHLARAIDRAQERLLEAIPPRTTPAESRPGPGVRLAYDREGAAAALGISLAHFQRHVRPHVKCVYLGRKRIYPVRELERWLEENQGARPAER